MLLQLYFCLGYYVLGATFDDGGNFNTEGSIFVNREEDPADEYDTLHNDFPIIQQWLVIFLQVLRTSIGDLQPPSYDYWVARYEMSDRSFAMTHVIIIWILWMFQIIIIVICMLNFLIAIVSDSYNYIVEREQLAAIERQEEIAYDSLYDTSFDSDIYSMIIASDFRVLASSAWEGATKVLKKRIKKLENAVHK